jgi:hypothetical protein
MHFWFHKQIYKEHTEKDEILRHIKRSAENKSLMITEILTIAMWRLEIIIVVISN